MKAFGPAPWGPAVDGEVPMVPTPVGAVCIHCQEPIAEGDEGTLVPCLGEAGPKIGAEHRECLLRGIVGSVGHQLGRCSCYGGNEDDPPGMTKREAARAAVEFATRRGSMTDREIEQRYPWVPWREPLPVKLLDATAEGLACRLCVAKEGLRGADVGKLAQTREEFERHMAERHPA